MNRSAGLPPSATHALHGLVALHSTNPQKTGATRSIRMAAPALQDHGISLHYVAVRSIAHFAPGFVAGPRRRYDFLLFNGLAAIARRSRFGFGLWRIAKRLRLPVFLYWHETDWVLDRYRRTDPDGARQVDEIAKDAATIHLTASRAGSATICRLYPEKDPIEVFECALVPPPWDQATVPDEPPLVVNMASIQERKGVDLFVRTAITVCREHATVKFVWLGEGERYGTWEAEIVRAGLKERILFPGYDWQPYRQLARASVFFLSSRDDPFPLSNLEAMQLGRSIVAFQTGGAPEALGGLGHLIPPFDTDLAATTILAILRKPPQSRLNLALRQRYLEEFTPERFSNRLAQVVKEHVKNDRR